ncbi:MAG: outer membrane beta-barrel protein [Pseudomonadota bacterium]
MFHRLFATTALCLVSSGVAADPGWEFGVGLGGSLIRDTDNGETFQGNSFALQVEGGYRFTDRFAFNVGYLSLGEASDTVGGVDTDIEVRALTLGFRFTFTPDSMARWYGRLGVVNYYADVDPGGVGLDEIFGQGAIDIGGGVEVDAGDSGAWFLEVRYLDGDDQEEGGAALLGYRFQF